MLRRITMIMLAIVLGGMCSAGSAHEMKSVYLERGPDIVWVSGADRYEDVVGLLQGIGFTLGKGPGNKTICVINTAAIIIIGDRDRGTSLRCGDLDVGFSNIYEHYMESLVEYVERFIKYARSPFVGERKIEDFYFTNDTGLPPLEVTMVIWSGNGSEQYNRASAQRLQKLLGGLEAVGYRKTTRPIPLIKEEGPVAVRNLCGISTEYFLPADQEQPSTVIGCRGTEKKSGRLAGVSNDSPNYVAEVLEIVKSFKDS